MATSTGFRPGSTITDMPNFSLRVRPAQNAIATTGSDEWPEIRSDTHSES